MTAGNVACSMSVLAQKVERIRTYQVPQGTGSLIYITLLNTHNHPIRILKSRKWRLQKFKELGQALRTLSMTTHCQSRKQRHFKGITTTLYNRASDRNIMQTMYVILNFPVVTFLKSKNKQMVIFIFYLTQYITDIIISTCKTITEIFFHPKTSKSNVYFILIAHFNLDQCTFWT